MRLAKHGDHAIRRQAHRLRHHRPCLDHAGRARLSAYSSSPERRMRAGRIRAEQGDITRAQGRRHRQRRQFDIARRRRRRWRDPPRRRPRPARRMPHARRLPHRRGAHHRRLQPAAPPCDPHRRPGLAGRRRQRGRASRQLLPRLAGACRDRACDSIAFPAISTGAYRYPLAAATEIAVRSALDFLDTDGPAMDIVFCCFDAKTRAVYEAVMRRLA